MLWATHFCAWMSSKEGKETVPSGRHLWGNWDVEELKERKEELWANEGLLTIGLMSLGAEMPEEVVR